MLPKSDYSYPFFGEIMKLIRIKPLLLAAILSNTGFAGDGPESFMDKISLRVHQKQWESIPEIIFNEGAGEYPDSMDKTALPPGGIAKFRLSDGRKGIVFRYHVYQASQLMALVQGDKPEPHAIDVVEGVFQRYTNDETNFAPFNGQNGIGYFLGTTGGCRDDTLQRLEVFIKNGILQMGQYLLVIDKKSDR